MLPHQIEALLAGSQPYPPQNESGAIQVPGGNGNSLTVPYVPGSPAEAGNAAPSTALVPVTMLGTVQRYNTGDLWREPYDPYAVRNVEAPSERSMRLADKRLAHRPVLPQTDPVANAEITQMEADADRAIAATRAILAEVLQTDSSELPALQGAQHAAMGLGPRQLTAAPEAAVAVPPETAVSEAGPAYFEDPRAVTAMPVAQVEAAAPETVSPRQADAPAIGTASVHGAINAREVIGRVLNGDSVPPGEFAALFRVEQTTGYAITPEERAAADAAAAASLATPQQKRPLSPAEAAAVEAAARGDVLPPDAFAALINDGTRVPAKDHGENTRPIRWTAQAPGGDGAQEGWMMPTRTAGATVPAIEAEAGDGYVSVMADVEIPEGALTAFAPEQPLSPAEFEARMRELNSERNLLEKALHDGDIAPEDAPATQARLAVVIDQETKLQAKGPGGRNGSDDSLGTMARVLAGLRKL